MANHCIRFLGASALLVAAAAQAAPVPGQGTWETTLLGRDLIGHAVSITDPQAEFAYDNVLDATWYLTANNSGLTWDEALDWAAGLFVGRFGGWQLPSALNLDGSAPCSGFCATGPMGELWFSQLGNPGEGPKQNTGPLKNLQTFYYWLSTEYIQPGLPTFHLSAWTFDAYAGYQNGNSKEGGPHGLYALAIRPGDVLVAVPEPGTSLALILGMVCLAGLTCRRRIQARATGDGPAIVIKFPNRSPRPNQTRRWSAK